jgi:hypothetical protein
MLKAIEQYREMNDDNKALVFRAAAIGARMLAAKSHNSVVTMLASAAASSLGEMVQATAGDRSSDQQIGE